MNADAMFSRISRDKQKRDEIVEVESGALSEELWVFIFEISSIIIKLNMSSVS